MPKIKYMGTADVFFLDKGEDVNGRVAGDAVLSKKVTWNEKNKWIVDTDEEGLHPDFVTALLEADPERFTDVTGKTKIPSSQHEMLFKGHKKTTTVASNADDAADEEPKATDVTPAAGPSEAGGPTAPAVGGSTDGDAGGKARRGGGTQ